jgi:transcriptional regulator with XRE-family HTH domain
VTPEQVERNRAMQAQLYGEALGDLFRRIAEALGLTQARLAATIGLSAPMLSQLISAQRVKIGNPAVMQRVQSLAELAAEAGGGRLPPAELARRLDVISGAQSVLTQTTRAGLSGEPQAAAKAIRALLRRTASEDELRSAVRTLESEHPALAELLRVYGLDSPDAAAAHFENVQRTSS